MAAGMERYKVLVIGDYGVGKTSLIQRYTQDIFIAQYKLTIGVDFSSKILNIDGHSMDLQLWDIAGHERFGHMTHVYYKYAIAAIIVFDIGRPATFDSVSKWHKDLTQAVVLSNGNPVPCILLANKCDMPSSEIDKEKLDKYCQEKQILRWFATSAKSNTNINEAMDFLAHEILKVSSELQQLPKEQEQFLRVEAEPPRAKPTPGEGCC
eukprot:m.227971 g.227971  ORF g.227971 m.227971 type:complete len:209 (+) comp17371_c0_seq1:79-705(+)